MILSKDTLYRVLLLLLLIIIIIENFCSRTKYAFMLGGGEICNEVYLGEK